MSLLIFAAAVIKRGLEPGYQTFGCHIRAQVGTQRGNQRLFTLVAAGTGVKTVALRNDMHVRLDRREAEPVSTER